MLQFNKSELELALIQIGVYKKETGEIISGLLTEELTLGTKRHLTKIQTKINDQYQELIKDYKLLVDECGENKEKLKDELQILLNEKVEIDIDSIPFSSIENVKTESSYNFDIIDKFAI